jgi:hypothetical protein
MALPVVALIKRVAGVVLTCALMVCNERAAGPSQAWAASAGAAAEIRFDA